MRRDDLEAAAKDVGRAIADALPQGVHFVLVLTGIGPVGNVSYFANVHRTDAIALLRDTADKIEAGGAP
jgi:hypothetical protein